MSGLNEKKVVYCKECREKKFITSLGTPSTGYWFKKSDEKICEYHGCEFKEINVPVNDFLIFTKISQDPDFLDAMVKLHDTDIIEYQTKMSQFKMQAEKQQEIASEKSRREIESLNNHSKTEDQLNIPKCPTCGSTNVQKISAGSRWLSTGLFGLGSSKVGKTMECRNCGYKW